MFYDLAQYFSLSSCSSHQHVSTFFTVNIRSAVTKYYFLFIALVALSQDK